MKERRDCQHQGGRGLGKDGMVSACELTINIDADWGPSFIRFCTYAPFGIRVWLNGHQWLRRQLERSGHSYQPLDNGIAQVDDPAALDRLCARFTAAHVQRFFDRWIYRLPNPFGPKDRRAGYTYQLSLLQLEIARTEVFDRPLHGRQFFEEVIQDQLDLGRPDKLQLIFGRQRLPRRPGPHRTRVFCPGVEPSLQAGYRNTRIKQYWKCYAESRIMPSEPPHGVHFELL